MNQEEIEIREDYIQIARSEIATHEEIERMLDAANVSPACREQMRENIHAAIRTQNFYVELARYWWRRKLIYWSATQSFSRN